MSHLLNLQHNVIICILNECDIEDIIILRKVCISFFKFFLNKCIISRIVITYLKKVEKTIDEHFNYKLFIDYSFKNNKPQLEKLKTIKNYIIGTDTFLSGGFLLGISQIHNILLNKDPDIHYENFKESDIDIFVDKNYILPECITITENEYFIEFKREFDEVIKNNDDNGYSVSYKLCNYILNINYYDDVYTKYYKTFKIQYIICDDPIEVIKNFDLTFLQSYYHEGKLNLISYHELSLIFDSLKKRVPFGFLTEEEKITYLFELKYYHQMYKLGYINRRIINKKLVDRLIKYIERGYTTIIDW
jgi:hypothetical protein